MPLEWGGQNGIVIKGDCGLRVELVKRDVRQGGWFFVFGYVLQQQERPLFGRTFSGCAPASPHNDGENPSDAPLPVKASDPCKDAPQSGGFDFGGLDLAEESFLPRPSAPIVWLDDGAYADFEDVKDAEETWCSSALLLGY